MKPFTNVKSIITPLDIVNVDTDQIVPKQFLKLVQRTGFGEFLFYDWRFDNEKNPKSDFVLNDPKFSKSKILLSRDNFGCGSSREHATWALKDFGFDVIIAVSFADIFFSNCFKNGILPITLDKKIIDELFTFDSQLQVDLEKQIIKYNTKIISFEIDSFRKQTLLEGLDDIAITLQYQDKIKKYETTSALEFS